MPDKLSLAHIKSSMIRVAVIGGGAAGLCAARHLLAKPDVFDAVVYEQSDQIGGTWVYTDNVGRDKWGQPVHSSMYSRLRTNIPKQVMLFPGLPLTEGGRTTFVKHEEVLQYLRRFADTFGLHKCIRLLTRVESVKPVISNCKKTAWEVTVKSIEEPNCKPEVHLYDAVMVCNGQYAVPRYPSIPGLETFHGKVLHSHEYRHPEDFEGQTVVLLGAGQSGADICVDLSLHADQVYLSHHGPFFKSVMPTNLQQVPLIESVEGSCVVFLDGQRIKADALLFCTGYQYSYPFLTPECEVVVDRKRVTSLYKHVIHTKFTSLSFTGVVRTVNPFPLMSCQVRFVMAALDGSMVLPSRAEMDADTQRDYEYRSNVLKMPHHHAHKLGMMQWEYNKELMRLANEDEGDDVIKPGIESLYEEVWRKRSLDLVNYKKDIFTMSDDLNEWSFIGIDSDSGRDDAKT